MEGGGCWEDVIKEEGRTEESLWHHCYLRKYAEEFKL